MLYKDEYTYISVNVIFHIVYKKKLSKTFKINTCNIFYIQLKLLV